jgi:putative flippase GtrA
MISRVIAASIAIFATYVLNSKFNFRVKLTWILASKYALVQGVGILINFLVYALAVNALGQAPTSLIFAIALGSLVAMIWNYKGASSLFRTGKIVRGEEVDSKPRMQD